MNEAIYQSKLLQQDQLLQLIQRLRDMNIFHCDIQFKFQTKPHLTEAQNQYELIKGVAFQQKPTYKLKQQSQISRQILHFEKTSAFQLKIFFRVYKDKLRQLQKQAKVNIIQRSKDIIIQHPHSHFLQKQILGLKQKLKLHYNKEHLDQIKYSKVLKDALEAKHVLVEVGYRWALFYTIKLSLQDMKGLLKEELKHHIDIVSVKIHSFSYYINRKLFKLLNELQPTLVNDIQKQYELLLEINYEEAAYVLHSKHPVFGVQPIRQIKDQMMKMKIFLLKSKHPIAVSNQIKRMKKRYGGRLSETYQDKLNTVVINTTLINQEILLNIVQVFLQLLDSTSCCTIYLPQFDKSSVQIERARILKQSALIDVINNHMKIIKFMPKNPFSLHQRQREMFLFFIWFIFDTTTVELTQEFIQDALKKKRNFKPDIKQQNKSVKSNNQINKSVKSNNQINKSENDLSWNSSFKDNLSLEQKEIFLSQEEQIKTEIGQINQEQNIKIQKNILSTQQSLNKNQIDNTEQQSNKLNAKQFQKNFVLQSCQQNFETNFLSKKNNSKQNNIVVKIEGDQKRQNINMTLQTKKLELQKETKIQSPSKQQKIKEQKQYIKRGKYEPLLKFIDYIEPKKVGAAEIIKGRVMQKVQQILNKASGSLWKCYLIGLNEQIKTSPWLDPNVQKKLVRDPLKNGQLHNSSQGILLQEIKILEQAYIVFWDQHLQKDIPVYLCKRIQ